jgi:hypothetical protein
MTMKALCTPLILSCLFVLACDGSSDRHPAGDPTRDGSVGDGDHAGDGDGDGDTPGDGDHPGDGDANRDGGTPGDGDGDGDGDDPGPSDGKVDLLMRAYNRQRTGANLKETQLTTANVTAEKFGKLHELDVDDQVYAQILYVSDLSIAGETCDVIYVATVNNTVYAFDAHTAGAPLWQRNFNGGGRPTLNTEVGGNCQPYRDFSGNIGIVGTPVIDRASHTMYFVTRGAVNGKNIQTLRAIDIVTGNDKPNGERNIEAEVAGTGDGSLGGKLKFDPLIENQRLALTLANGLVYMGWSGFCDTGDYHGWFMAYDAKTLEQAAVLNITPDGLAGGLWQAGAGPVVDDDGNLFLVTGNGDYDGSKNLGQTVIKLDGKALKVLDHFAPSNYSRLNQEDWDLGSSGPTWLPGTQQIVTAGKEGKLYLLDMAHLGAMKLGDTQIPQHFQAVSQTVRPNSTHHMHNAVTVWDGPDGLHMYVSGENDYLASYRYNPQSSTFDLPPAKVSEVLPPLGMPGGMMTLSADGAKAGSGIVWVTTPRAGDANQNVTPGILRAYNAESLELLWDSSSDADDVHNFAKFNNPTVVNGKVYVASFSNAINVYGLRDGVPEPPDNLTDDATAFSDAQPCALNEAVSKVVDGKVYAQDENDKFKWCTHTAAPSVLVDLGEVLNIGRVIVRHAGAGGESIDLNTRAFTIEVGDDETMLDKVADVTDNRESSTIHDFPAVDARYVRLTVTNPTQNGNTSTRIYEIEVYAP